VCQLGCSFRESRPKPPCQSVALVLSNIKN
jgi:hypothetical protein